MVASSMNAWRPVNASARKGGLHYALWKPAGGDRHNRVPHNAQVLCQLEGDACPTARCKRKKMDVKHRFEYTLNVDGDVDGVAHVPLDSFLLYRRRATPRKLPAIGPWSYPAIPRRR